MNTSELQRGKIYRIRLTDGSWTAGRYEWTEKKEKSWANYRSVTHYHFTNMNTGRAVVVKSRVRIGREV